MVVLNLQTSPWLRLPSLHLPLVAVLISNTAAMNPECSSQQITAMNRELSSCISETLTTRKVEGTIYTTKRTYNEIMPVDLDKAQKAN
eukprot:6492309-Amphidinium_carterae.6